MSKFHYKDWTLFKAIDALMAYDDGASDSGVSDANMRSAVIDHFSSLDDMERRRICAGFVKELLSEENLDKGYGLEDVRNFLDWLEEIGVTAA